MAASVNRAQFANTGTATTIASPATSHTAGNLLVAMFAWAFGGSGTFTSIADTAGNTWTQVATEVTVGGNRLRMYYAANCLGHASNIVTVTLAATVVYRALVVHQFSGIALSSVLSDSDTGTGVGTALATPSLTIAAAEEVIVAFMLGDSAMTAGGAGYTFDAFNATGDAVEYYADEYKIVTASEAATATANFSNWGILAGTFAAVAGRFFLLVHP